MNTIMTEFSNNGHNEIKAKRRKDKCEEESSIPAMNKTPSGIKPFSPGVQCPELENVYVKKWHSDSGGDPRWRDLREGEGDRLLRIPQGA